MHQRSNKELSEADYERILDDAIASTNRTIMRKKKGENTHKQELQLFKQKQECKQRFVDKNKQFRKSYIVFAVIARFLVAWEKLNGSISMQEVRLALREELRRLNIEGEE